MAWRFKLPDCSLLSDYKSPSGHAQLEGIAQKWSGIYDLVIQSKSNMVFLIWKFDVLFLTMNATNGAKTRTCVRGVARRAHLFSALSGVSSSSSAMSSSSIEWLDRCLVKGERGEKKMMTMLIWFVALLLIKWKTKGRIKEIGVRNATNCLKYGVGWVIKFLRWGLHILANLCVVLEFAP